MDTNVNRKRICIIALGVLSLLGVGRVSSAQLQMPDPKQMSGIPRPVDDLPTGSVSVRLIRGQPDKQHHEISGGTAHRLESAHGARPTKMVERSSII